MFDKPIGENQGVAFPIAKAHMNLSAAQLMRNQAATLFDAGLPCGGESNMVKYLCSEASWEAAEAAMTTFGGFGVATEYDIERKWKDPAVSNCTCFEQLGVGLFSAALAEHAALILN